MTCLHTCSVYVAIFFIMNNIIFNNLSLTEVIKAKGRSSFAACADDTRYLGKVTVITIVKYLWNLLTEKITYVCIYV